MLLQTRYYNLIIILYSSSSSSSTYNNNNKQQTAQRDRNNGIEKTAIEGDSYERQKYAPARIPRVLSLSVLIRL